jgi:hypothetical protein
MALRGKGEGNHMCSQGAWYVNHRFPFVASALFAIDSISTQIEIKYSVQAPQLPFYRSITSIFISKKIFPFFLAKTMKKTEEQLGQ